MIYIRRVEARDFPTVVEMIGLLAKHHGDTAVTTVEDLEREMLGVRPWVTGMVAVDNGRLVGYAALCPIVKLQFGTRGMEMLHLFVRDGLRGQGIGKKLITACIEISEGLGCGYMTVGTHPDNCTAQDIYKSTGFELIENSPKFIIQVPQRLSA